VLVTVVGIQAVGMLLIVALLIIPPAAARFWSERLSVVTILSALIGGISGYLGVITSSIWSDMPAGAVIVLASGSIFVFSFVLAPQRGVIASIVNLLRLRTRIACDHVLRLMLEVIEEQRGTDRPEATVVEASRIAHARSWSPFMLALALGWLRFRGMLDKRGASLVLTTQGATAAARVTRNHRIWERFLVTHADLAVSHVDRSADLVEHVLSAEMIAQLEQDLALDDPLPPSVHTIGEDSGLDDEQ
jgi:manganese/zinc/iron transport system permease protein